MQNMLANSRAQGLKPHIIFLTTSAGFPHGMAATQRIRLIAKALVEKGVKVTVYCLSAYEINPIQNIQAKGTYQGINFEYTPGTTQRSKSFFMRRWFELIGYLLAILNIINLAKNKELDGVYLWGTVQNLNSFGSVISLPSLVIGGASHF